MFYLYIIFGREENKLMVPSLYKKLVLLEPLQTNYLLKEGINEY